jgi:ABC-type nitrate/sulfonate/bicarbonate transport system permease component
MAANVRALVRPDAPAAATLPQASSDAAASTDANAPNVAGSLRAWSPPAAHATALPPNAPATASVWMRLLPFIGPVLLFLVWDLVVRFGLIKAILLPPPGATLLTLVEGMAGGSLLTDFGVTVWRTLQAFLLAAVVGVPLGVVLGSSERAYRSVEFLIDFFRSTPSSALIPLFLLVFGTSDINKVAIAAFGAILIVIFNSAYGVMNARKQRVMAARVMGASRWRIFKDVLLWESMQPSFVGLRSAVSMALVIVIVAEMFIGSDSGLGHRIINSQQVMNVRDMYASILSAGALGYAVNIVFLWLERRIVHWSGR